MNRRAAAERDREIESGTRKKSLARRAEPAEKIDGKALNRLIRPAQRAHFIG
jgi:hypothetical protein